MPSRRALTAAAAAVGVLLSVVQVVMFMNGWGAFAKYQYTNGVVHSGCTEGEGKELVFAYYGRCGVAHVPVCVCGCCAHGAAPCAPAGGQTT